MHVAGQSVNYNTHTRKHSAGANSYITLTLNVEIRPKINRLPVLQTNSIEAKNVTFEAFVKGYHSHLYIASHYTVVNTLNDYYNQFKPIKQ